MDIQLILIISLVASIVVLAVMITKLKAATSQLNDLEHENHVTTQELSEELNSHKSELQNLITAKTEAETRLSETLKNLETLSEENLGNQQKFNSESDARQQAEIKVTEFETTLRGMKERMADWEEAKKQTLEAAKAATLETATQVSSKLIEDHKRESVAAKEESQKAVQATTEKLFAQFEVVSKSIGALDKGVDDNRTTMEVIQRALSSPGGAGQYAEIGLENTLKSFGLEKDRDFVLQKQIDGKLRPDAMIFLPGDTVIVVDSKASKFLLELAEAESEESIAEANQNLAKTMRTHLSQLAGKDYKTAVRKEYANTGRSHEINHIVSIMYLPNEGAVEKLSNADPEFVKRAAKLELTIAGPAALSCLIGFSRVQIDYGKRAENQEKIIETVQKILNNLGVVLEKGVTVGKSLKQASERYESFAKSINGNLLPNVRKVMDLGVRPDRHKGIPPIIPSYQVIEHDNSQVIDAEAEEVSNLSLPSEPTE